jgi:formate hydrogenlyase transcriptional activator
LLLEHFVRRSARKVGSTIRSIAPDVLERLEGHSWPGNVRELENVIERSVIVCESETFAVDPSWLQSRTPHDAPEPNAPTTCAAAPPESAPPAAPASPVAATLDEIQRDAVLRALRSRGWVISGPRGAAALLGLKRTTLLARMRKLGITSLRPAARGVLAEEPVPNAW